MELEANIIKKYESKSVANLVQTAQKYFNAYVRKRDSENGYFKCIACGLIKPIDQMHCGHFFSVGNFQSIRFHLDNAHGEYHRCNTYLHGNLIPYSENLIKKIGRENYDKLETLAYQRNYKHDRITLIEVIERYKTKIQEL